MTNVDIGKLYGVCRKFIDVWDRPYSDPAEFGPLVEELREAVGMQQELDRYEDMRVNLAQRAFTAPDASDEEMLESLDARIRDAVSANDTPPSGDVVEQAAELVFATIGSGNWATIDEWRKSELRRAAQALADAGLLRTPPPQEDPWGGASLAKCGDEACRCSGRTDA